MSRFLSEENINLVEEFISVQEPSDSIIEAYCSVIRKYYNIDNNWIMLMPYEEFMKQLLEK